MVRGNVYGRYHARQSNQPLLRNRPHLDNQTFRITRGKPDGQMFCGNGQTTRYRPLPGYWRKATCEEVACKHWSEGWVINLDLDPALDPEELHLNQARSGYIRNQSGRAFTVTFDGTTEVFRFEAGQKCFKEHQIPVERDPVFLQIKGPGQVRQMDHDQFVDTYNETAYQLIRRMQDG